MAEQAYCVKCKTKREMKNAKVETNDKGRRMMRGECANCGTKMTRFLPAK